MSDNSSDSRSGGIGFLGLLFIVLLTLKLTDVIDWSWWWVTAPLWGGFAFVLSMIASFFGVVVLAVLAKSLTKGGR